MGKVDKVRASRDGHEFHEVLGAHIALQMLLPGADLVGIAVEGLHPKDQERASAQTIEIADITLYYGEEPTFESAHSVTITQFKYSVSKRDAAFRHSDAKKTISKFADAYRECKKTYGAESVRKKLRFELVTNRPVYEPFLLAIRGTATSALLSGEAKKQGTQLKEATKLSGMELIEFAQIMQIKSTQNSLRDSKQKLLRTIVNLSGRSSAETTLRFRDLTALVRDKAGTAGDGRNVIGRVDVLAALGIDEPEDLFPCPTRFSEVGEIVSRRQLNEVTQLVPQLTEPLVIHAAGGVGKTVFLRSLSASLLQNCEVVLFDCFGGGAYRARGDWRHQPSRGIVQLINELACRGLCDLLLPGSASDSDLLRKFRRRLEQCAHTLQSQSESPILVLIIDAIDNAAIQAESTGTVAFPTEILNAVDSSGAIDGVRLVVSCRTERLEKALKGVKCLQVKLEPFDHDETREFLRTRLRAVPESEVQVAQARSRGNGRILEYLVSEGRGVFEPTEVNHTISLDDLLDRRVFNAVSDARKRGHTKSDIETFLSGLSALPPPIPLEEIAGAHSLGLSAVESFAADMAPLLEYTGHGLIFRDEPTETRIRNEYLGKADALERVEKFLNSRQEVSVYAAYALPNLLHQTKNTKQLFELAFDKRFPKSATSETSRTRIRIARLRAALRDALTEDDRGKIIELMAELSTVALYDQRGADYIVSRPELAVCANDKDATRLMFETRTSWPGKRHARLAIANRLFGYDDEACRHMVKAMDWVRHYLEQERENESRFDRPEPIDIAAIIFCSYRQSSASKKYRFIREWRDWFGYMIADEFFRLQAQANLMSIPCEVPTRNLLNHLTDEIGFITCAIAKSTLTPQRRKRMLKTLAFACERKQKVDVDRSFHKREWPSFEDSLRKSAALAISDNLHSDAQQILKLVPNGRPNLWTFGGYGASDQDVPPFLIYAATTAAAQGRPLRIWDILPRELADICEPDATFETPYLLRKTLLSRLDETNPAGCATNTLSKETTADARRFINTCLDPLHTLAMAMAAFLSSPKGKKDRTFQGILTAWIRARNSPDEYGSRSKKNWFLNLVGRRVSIVALWTCDQLSMKSVDAIIDALHSSEVLGPKTLIEIVSILSARKGMSELAGREAVKAKELIEFETEVQYKAAMYANLARAILPASIDEAGSYFRLGVEQMEAVGSEDYGFVSGLLKYCSSSRGAELDDVDVHTLTNLCELNLSEEEEKFPWDLFANAIARVAGCRGLAKLCRWADRERISLNCSLLPYLSGLLAADKINPHIALALLRLSIPIELYVCNTRVLAAALVSSRNPFEEELFRELINQYLTNHSNGCSDDTLQILQSTYAQLPDFDSELNSYLQALLDRQRDARSMRNPGARERVGTVDKEWEKKRAKEDKHRKSEVGRHVAGVDPTNATSIDAALDLLNQRFEGERFRFESDFFGLLRPGVKYAKRTAYLRTLIQLESIDLFQKLSELEKCKDAWGATSLSLEDNLRPIGPSLVRAHSREFLDSDYFSISRLDQVSGLSGVPVTNLALELAKSLTSKEIQVPASVWLGLCSVLSGTDDADTVRKSIARILNSKATAFNRSAKDGEWHEGMYPPDDQVNIAAGITWLQLGSPSAAERWRAAHSVRCFAKFGKWDVVDALVEKNSKQDASPFQAPELKFFFLHARLWLLISLARIARDSPLEIGKYKKFFMHVVHDKKYPHVLLRHFAGSALLECEKHGEIYLSEEERLGIQNVNHSPFPLAEEKEHDFDDDASPSKSPFHFDYDFLKYNVSRLCRIFGRPRQDVQGKLVAAVHDADSLVNDMYDKGGRTLRDRTYVRGMTSEHHTYGQQLVWHAQFVVAGQLLKEGPVHGNYSEDDPWSYWLESNLLTRDDGLWLSDGLDLPPTDTMVKLLEGDEFPPGITGKKKAILDLICKNDQLRDEYVLYGSWRSADYVKVYVQSALVAPRNVKVFIDSLLLEPPCVTVIPTLDEDESGEEYHNYSREHCKPWIVVPSRSACLDRDDSLGSVASVNRPRFCNEIVQAFSLTTDDTFNCAWRNAAGKIIANSEGWRRGAQDEDESDGSGVRFRCASDFLRNVLRQTNSDLVILVNLEVHRHNSGEEIDGFFNTIACVHLNKSMKLGYIAGVINHRQPPR